MINKMNVKYFNIIIVIALVTILSACNRDEIFEREQYKHVISLLSESEGAFNIFTEEHDPANSDEEGYTDGYVAASVGGSLVTDQPIVLSLVEDASILGEYNNSNFALESFKYARYLSSGRYSIKHPVISIPAGERRGKMKIRIRAAGLSPDSIYFIPLRVDQSSTYEMNTAKSTVLYRVCLKNFWASTASYQTTQYNHKGIRYEEDSDAPATTMMMKDVHPLSGNEVRIFAGNKSFEQSLEAIEAWAIRLAVDNDGKVTISPYAGSRFAMKVTQIDGDEEYPNVFKIVDNGWGNLFKTFLLYYEYVDPTDNITYRIKEELRITHSKTVI